MNMKNMTNILRLKRGSRKQEVKNLRTVLKLLISEKTQRKRVADGWCMHDIYYVPYERKRIHQHSLFIQFIWFFDLFCTDFQNRKICSSNMLKASIVTFEYKRDTRLATVWGKKRICIVFAQILYLQFHFYVYRLQLNAIGCMGRNLLLTVKYDKKQTHTHSMYDVCTNIDNQFREFVVGQGNEKPNCMNYGALVLVMYCNNERISNHMLMCFSKSKWVASVLAGYAADDLISW
jgi:hypothetical protein